MINLLEDEEWIIEKIPDDIRKREYLYYLLEVGGMHITSSCRDYDWYNWVEGNVICFVYKEVDIMYIRKDTAKGFTCLEYSKAIKMLEKELNINKNDT